MLSWNVAVLARGAVNDMLRDISAEHYWDVIFVQEYSTARPEGIQVVDSHLVLIGGSERDAKALP